MNLVSFFQQFFRHQPDGVISMTTFDQTHLMLLALTVLGCAFILNDYYLIFKQDKFKKVLAYTLLAQQAIMYAWYFSAGQYFNLAEALPLYNCRIAIFCAIIGLLTNNQTARLITSYWGIFGGVVALIVINPDQFLFPRISSGISFCCGLRSILSKPVRSPISIHCVRSPLLPTFSISLSSVLIISPTLTIVISTVYRSNPSSSTGPHHFITSLLF